MRKEPLSDIVKLPSMVKHKLCDIICDDTDKEKTCPFYSAPESYDNDTGHRTNCWKWEGINEMQLLMIKVKYKVNV